MNENELYVVQEYKFNNPLITKQDFIIDSCFRNCLNKYFHNFKYECIYDIVLTNITNSEIIFLTTTGKSMNLYELNKNLKVVRHNGFIFNQINKLTKNFYSHVRYINTSYYLIFRIAMCQRHLFRIISQNRKFIEKFCNDMEKPFHFACKKWFNQLNQKLYIIF